jgi:hypothetical protein
MDAQRALDREARVGLGEDALALFQRELPKCLILQTRDFLALVDIADPSLEARIAAGARIEQLAPSRGGVDGLIGEAKAPQPPATGGMNTTASPAAKRRDQGANSELTATLSCSRGKVKP